MSIDSRFVDRLFTHAGYGFQGEESLSARPAPAFDIDGDHKISRDEFRRGAETVAGDPAGKAILARMNDIVTVASAKKKKFEQNRDKSSRMKRIGVLGMISGLVGGGVSAIVVGKLVETSLVASSVGGPLIFLSVLVAVVAFAAAIGLILSASKRSEQNSADYLDSANDTKAELKKAMTELHVLEMRRRDHQEGVLNALRLPKAINTSLPRS